MMSFWEVANRAISTSPLMKIRNFDLKISKVTSTGQTVRGQYGSEAPIPCDDDLADRLFEAGLNSIFRQGQNMLAPKIIGQEATLWFQLEATLIKKGPEFPEGYARVAELSGLGTVVVEVSDYGIFGTENIE